MQNMDPSIIKDSISPENIDYYHEAGFLVAPELFTTDEITLLRKETAAIFRGERGTISGLLPVSATETDEEILKKYVAIHFPHKLSGLIREWLGHPAIIAVLRQLIGPNIKCMQSMLFVKGPGKAGQSWHQDEFYIPTRDRSLVGGWIAIDDATVDNGCLWIIPGRPDHIMRRIKNESPEYADSDTIDVSALEEAAIPVQVKSGTVVFFHGYTLHSSRRNHTTDSFRMALVNHYMNAGSMLPWDQDGNQPPTEDLRDIVMVAGTDPYAWKGTVDVNKPFLRPEILHIKK
jgi:phytanoyl-CoA hydroxylase